jgi:hypothetical protein
MLTFAPQREVRRTGVSRTTMLEERSRRARPLAARATAVA